MSARRRCERRTFAEPWRTPWTPGPITTASTRRRRANYWPRTDPATACWRCCFAAESGRFPAVASISALLDVLSPAGRGGGVPAQRRPASLPAKRKKSDGPAPIFQLKVGLRGARPPIWRRLEVPADVTLARLHELIQAAFAWDDSHLHVFETRYGNFGRPDSELGHRAASRVTLEQVVPAVGDKLCYTYDFGDNWTHDIAVEKILNRDPSVAYPRCTGGRRAAPPEDCGGVWGYAELMGILEDPTHPEHRERLDGLGLDDRADFDPARFNAKAVTTTLQHLQ
jgi:hypothetical protein